MNWSTIIPWYCRVVLGFSVIVFVLYLVILTATLYRATVPMVTEPEDFTYSVAKRGDIYFGIPERYRHLYTELSEENFILQRNYLYTIWIENEVRESLHVALSALVMLGLMGLLFWTHYALLKRYRA